MLEGGRARRRGARRNEEEPLNTPLPLCMESELGNSWNVCTNRDRKERGSEKEAKLISKRQEGRRGVHTSCLLQLVVKVQHTTVDSIEEGEAKCSTESKWEHKEDRWQKSNEWGKG